MGLLSSRPFAATIVPTHDAISVITASLEPTIPASLSSSAAAAAAPVIAGKAVPFHPVSTVASSLDSHSPRHINVTTPHPTSRHCCNASNSRSPAISTSVDTPVLARAMLHHQSASDNGVPQSPADAAIAAAAAVMGSKPVDDSSQQQILPQQNQHQQHQPQAQAQSHTQILQDSLQPRIPRLRDEDEDDEMVLDGRKSLSRRALSTSKRAEQNRVAQVGIFNRSPDCNSSSRHKR